MLRGERISEQRKNTNDSNVSLFKDGIENLITLSKIACNLV